MVKRSPMLLSSLALSALLAGPAAAQEAAVPVQPAQPVQPYQAARPAQPPPREVRVVARMGLDGGGATLDKVTMSDGSTQKLSAGGLFTIAAGLIYAPVATPVVVEATIGYKVDDVTASNGQLRFARWPLELLASYRVDRHRVGGGVTHHFSPRYSCSIDGGFCLVNEINFDDANGLVLQYAYGDLNGRFAWDVGARLTLIDYKVPGDSIAGNSFGAFLTFGF